MTSLALHRTGCHALDDVLLAEQVDDDDGQNRHHNNRHGGAQIHGAVAALQILDMNGNGTVGVGIQHQIRQQVVIPDPHQLQNTHGDHGGLQHRQHHLEVSTHSAAAIDGGSFLDLQRQTLDEANEHEDGQTRAKAQIDHWDGVGGVQLQLVGGEGQGEHDHLEGDDHGEQAQVVENPCKGAVHTGDVPSGHGAEQQNQEHRSDGDDQAVQQRQQEGVVTEGQALQIVGKANEGLAVRQSEGLQIDEVVFLDGVDDHLKNGEQPHKAQQRKKRAENIFAQRILFHCCTSLLRVAAC